MCEDAALSATTRRRPSLWWHRSLAIKVVAFVKRDARIETSYKFQFIWSFATVLFTIATFHFVGKMVTGQDASRALARYAGNYFSFVVLGLAITQYLQASLMGMATEIRQAMNQGTLEIMFASPTRPMTVLSLSLIWKLLFETVRVLFCLSVATAFGFHMTNPNWFAALITMVLTLSAFLSLGVLSASLLILLKRGDPINWFAVGAASLLGGSIFPVELLPDWLRTVSFFIPLTHSLHCLRGALLLGESVSDMWSSMLPLALFSLVMLPTAFVASGIMLRNAKRDGALGTF